jgi:hypothetical protein
MSDAYEPTQTCIFQAPGTIVEAEIPARLLLRLAEGGQMLFEPDTKRLVIQFSDGETYALQAQPVTLN